MNKDLKSSLDNFRADIRRLYPKSSNNRFVYLRLSALDNSIKKEKRIDDTIDKLKSDINKLIEDYPELKEGFKLDIEVKSAYKDSEREVFNQLCENYLFKDFSIKEVIYPKIPKRQINLYVSSYDRISRVFLYSLPIQILRLFRNIRINTLIPEEIVLEDKGENILNKSNQEQLIWVFQQMMNSQHASQHSEDLSNKVKKRVSTNKAGETISNKSGNKWGRAKTISNAMKKRIVERNKKFSYKEISEQHDIFQTVNKKRKPISMHTIRAIISEYNK